MRTSKFSVNTSKIFSVNRGFAAILLMALIAATLIIAGTFFYLKQNKKNPPVDQSTTQSPQTVVDETANWENIVDDVNNIEVKYPVDWIVTAAGSKKANDETLEQALEEDKKLPPFNIRYLSPGSTDNPQPVSDHQKIVEETINPVLNKRVFTAYILKDSANFIAIQAIPPTEQDPNQPFSQDIAAIFDQILSTFKFLD